MHMHMHTPRTCTCTCTHQACIDHPHVDPRYEGDARVRYVYMSYCNDEGVSGSPPMGWMRWDWHPNLNTNPNPSP